MFLTAATSVKWHGQSRTYHSSGAASLPHCSITPQDECSWSGRKIINNLHGILHPGRCKLTRPWGIKKRRQNSCNICLSAIFLKCGRERITERGTIECKVLVFFPTTLHRLHPTLLPPPRTRPWGKTSRNLHQIRRCHIKNGVTEKAVMAGKDVAAVWLFLLGSVHGSPVFWGCTLSEGAALRPDTRKWDLILMAVWQFGMRDSG